MKTKSCIYLASFVIAVSIAGCGSDTSTDSATDTSSQPTAVTEAVTTAPTPLSGAGTPGKPPKVSGSLKKKPVIATPSGDPPTELVIKDIKVGTGAEAEDGDSVSVQYVGDSWSTGEEFDASWNRGQAFTFDLGAGGVIPGWDQGVKGMKVGGRRLLVIPPELAYGPAGQGGIAPNETLVFVVDLEKVKKP